MNLNFSSPVFDFAGRQLSEGLAEDVAALDNLKGADKEAGTDVAGLLDRDVKASSA